MKLTSNEIQQILPHRYPFLMVDTIEEIVDENTIIGKKNISVNEAIFQGHFPDQHIFPGVLLIEALAATGAVLLLSKPAFKGKYVYLAGVNNMRFRKVVLPGDSVYLHCTLKSMRSNFGIAKVHAVVNDTIVCDGEIMFAIANKE
ncbi:MAG: 3-hydroxyacyl-ACP dehydratase FabZ [Erysipelotrichaceae bacterium]|nr:3-hydroxyacyl-ACP dehydratase FabZ [Erysipelotrichaceae bacterium]